MGTAVIPVIRFCYKTGFYRVLMNVICFLVNDFVVIQQSRAVHILPELVGFVHGIFFSMLFESGKHPFFPAFFFVVLNKLNESFGGKCFEITQNIAERFITTETNHVKVICHDDIFINFQVLFALAKIQVLNDVIEINTLGKYINPVHYGKGDKIKFIGLTCGF